MTAVLFWLWPQAHLQDFEVAHAEDRHQGLADNLSNQLAEYGFDVNNLIELVARDQKGTGQSRYAAAMLASKEIRRVCIYDSNSGRLKRSILAGPTTCRDVIEDSVRERLPAIPSPISVSALSPLDLSSEDEHVFHVVSLYGDEIVVGAVAPNYIERLGNDIRFGKSGHVVIVDQAGTILSHPSASWIEERRNLLKVDAFRKTMNGFKGTQRFYSTALKSDMIAGSAPVPVFGWAVVVLQPVSEVRSIVRQFDHTGLLTLGVGLLLATIVASILGHLIASPLARLTRAANLVSRGQLDIEFPHFDNYRLVPREIRIANKAIREMTITLRDNADALEYLAGTDDHTGLCNRRAFMNFAEKIFDRRRRVDGIASLLFLDLDDLKKVNDTYGHRAGDQLIKCVASRILQTTTQWHSQIQEHQECDSGRMGGDEFAVMIIASDEKQAFEFAELLQKNICIPVDIDNGVSIKVGCSIGIAFAQDNHDDLVELIHEADSAMYVAKETRKSPYWSDLEPAKRNVVA